MSTAENSDIFPLTVLPCPEAKGPRIGPVIRQPNAEVNFGQTRKQNPAKQGNDLWPNEEVPCRITAKAATVGDAVGNHRLSGRWGRQGHKRGAFTSLRASRTAEESLKDNFPYLRLLRKILEGTTMCLEHRATDGFSSPASCQSSKTTSPAQSERGA